jgi:TRAP-type C4-dicarboxylate transport system permease large subunit
MALLLITFVVLLIIGLPVAMSMAVASLTYIVVTGTVPDFAVIHRMVGGIDSFPLLAVPFFILAGNLMNAAGITARIYNFAVALVGWMRGGLGHVNVIGSVIFSGMSGAAIADAAGLGTIEIKAMNDHGYPIEFSVGVTAASATLGPIIPPSLPFVIYGTMANVSIGNLFLGGIMPGMVMTVFMMITVAYFARKYNWGHDTAFSWVALRRAAIEVAMVVLFPLSIWVAVNYGHASINWAASGALALLLLLDWYFAFAAVMALMAPVLLIGGMTLGWFTPTEAAMAAVIWALFLGLVRYRSLSWKGLAKVSFDTIETTASIMFIVAAASIFGWLLTVTQVATILTNAILAFTSSPWVFLLLANVLILFVGCFLETIAAITILVPILMPIVLKLGIDPVHFGLIMTLNLMIGLLHPPLGMVLFVLARVAKLSVERTTMAILPWLVPLFAALIAITYVPQITLWLPQTIGITTK